jgi:hypothetical protein
MVAAATDHDNHHTPLNGLARKDPVHVNVEMSSGCLNVVYKKLASRSPVLCIPNVLSLVHTGPQPYVHKPSCGAGVSPAPASS